MAAGLGFKDFTTGEVLTAADVDGYLMQGIWVFANATARDAAVTSPQEGNFAFTKDNNSLWYYDGATWVASGATGDIEGVTAGVGISGGGTSGTVTITNSMATAIDAKGDLVAGTGADTFSRIAVGADATVLTADSSTATGLKWATPGGSGANWSLLNTGGTSLNGVSTVTVSGISGKDKIVILVIGGSTSSSGGNYQVRFNGDTGNNYIRSVGRNQYASSYSSADHYLDESTTGTAWTMGNGGNSASDTGGFFLQANGCNASGVKVMQFTFAGTGTNSFTNYGGGIYTGSSTISSVEVYSNTGNWDAGTVYVYTSA
jgi:hypothetical protein